MDTKKLRQKILDLAIRGKLVPQDPNDEPASVLLERIRAEKERLIKEGKIKRSKKSTSDTPHYENEVPFEVPESWEWVKLCDITSVIGDGLHGTPQYDVKGDYFFINGNNLLSRQILIKDDTKKVSIEEYEKYKKPLNDTTILVSINGTIGNVGTFKDEKVILGKSACYFNIIPFLIKEYICTVIESQYFLKYALSSATGSTIKNVPLQAINDFFVPIPPIGEQKRIIEAIEQWLSIVGVLENEKNDLFKNIQQSKTKILDHAIHGKLVPQDPDDEPAIELLKRINPKFTPCDNPHYPFDVPPSWVLTTIETINKYKSSSIEPYNYMDEQFELYSVPTYETGMPEFVLGSNISSSKKIVKKGDVLLCKINPHLNRVWFVTHHKKNLTCIASSEWIIVRNEVISSRYLLYCFSSPYFLELMLSNVSGVGGSLMRAQPSFVEKYLFPLPPFQEQLRIVAKIEELFAVLDEIKKSLEA